MTDADPTPGGQEDVDLDQALGALIGRLKPPRTGGPSSGVPPTPEVRDGVPEDLAGPPGDRREPHADLPAPPCWSCGQELPPGPDPCPHCLASRAWLEVTLHCPQPLTLRAGDAPLRLGRDPAWAPLAAPGLAGSPGVSRRHAVLALAADGTAWVTDGEGPAPCAAPGAPARAPDGAPAAGSMNGTWVNGTRLPPGGSLPLRDGDGLALGRRVHGTVRVYAHGSASGGASGG